MRERLRRDLEARGIDPIFVDAVMARLGRAGAGGAAHAAILDGVAAAYRAHQKGQENLRRSLRDLSEMSRVMEDFGAELRKLDEALKMLAAHLGRMRARSLPQGRTLH
jgi:hypothetical protein